MAKTKKKTVKKTGKKPSKTKSKKATHTVRTKTVKKNNDPKWVGPAESDELLPHEEDVEQEIIEEHLAEDLDGMDSEEEFFADQEPDQGEQ